MRPAFFILPQSVFLFPSVYDY